MNKTLTTLCLAGAFSLAQLASAQSFWAIDDFTYSAADDPTIVISNATHPSFTGFDDTFNGTVSIDLTWAAPPGLDAWNLTDSIWYIFQFHTGSTEGGFIGNAYGSDNWSYYDGVNGGDLLDSGGNPVKPNSANPVALEMTINYVAGADDTASISFLGGNNVLTATDYGFDNIRMRGLGNDHQFSNLSVSVAAVPEPSALVVLLGSIALAAVGLRRRRA